MLVRQNWPIQKDKTGPSIDKSIYKSIDKSITNESRFENDLAVFSKEEEKERAEALASLVNQEKTPKNSDDIIVNFISTNFDGIELNEKINAVCNRLIHLSNSTEEQFINSYLNVWLNDFSKDVLISGFETNYDNLKDINCFEYAFKQFKFKKSDIAKKRISDNKKKKKPKETILGKNYGKDIIPIKDEFKSYTKDDFKDYDDSIINSDEHYYKYKCVCGEVIDRWISECPICEGMIDWDSI